MKAFLFSLLGALLSLSVSAQSLPPAEWAVACGSGPAAYLLAPVDVVVDAQGNTYVTGYFTGTITLGPYSLSATRTAPGSMVPKDTYLAKISPQGQYQWAIQLGDGQSVYVLRAATDNVGNVYLTGNFDSYSMQFGVAGPVLYNSSNNSEGFVASFAGQSGQCQWARRFGGTGNDTGGQLLVSQTGGVYLSGFTGDGSADFGSLQLAAAPRNASRSFLAKLTTAGAWLWAQQLSSNGDFEVSDLLTDNQGSLFLAGGFHSPGLTLGSVALTTTSCGGTPGYDVVVAKYTDAGALVWAVQGSAGGQNAVGYALSSLNMAYDGLGHLYLTGSFASLHLQLGSLTLTNASRQNSQPVPAPAYPCFDRYGEDAYVAQLDATTGAWLWAARRGGLPNERAYSPVLDGSGRLWLAYMGQQGQQLLSLDPTTKTWGSGYDLPATTRALLANDQLRRLYVAGSFSGASLTLGGQVVAGAGSGYTTGFVARLGQLPLGTTSALATASLQAWPTPGPGTGVWVQGAKVGQAVEVYDVLGRRVGGGRMPASGPLRLSWPGAGLAPGLYVLRCGPASTRWVVEA